MEYKYYLALALASPLAIIAYTIALGYTPLSEQSFHFHMKLRYWYSQS